MQKPSEHANRLWSALNAYDEGFEDGVESGKLLRFQWAFLLFAAGMLTAFLLFAIARMGAQ